MARTSINTSWQNVPYFELSDENKKYIASVLSNNNKILKKWYNYVPCGKKRSFRNSILNGNFFKISEFIPESLHVTFLDDCFKIQKTRKEKINSLDGKTVEEAVIAGYSRLVLKRIYDFYKKSNSKLDNISDMYQEAYIKIIDAMYSYADENVCFSTFLCVVVQNHLYQMINDVNLIKIPYAEKKLIKNFKKLQKERFIVSNEVINLEQYLFESNLKDKETSKLQKALISLQHNKMFFNGIDDESNMDIPDKSSSCEFVTSNSSEFDSNIKQKVKESILNANLTKKEKEVLEYALSVDMKYGWQTQLAKHMSVTKMRVSQLVKSAFGKIKNHILTN